MTDKMANISNQESVKGTYIGVRYSKKDEEKILNLIKEMRVPNPIPEDDIHTTLIFSRRYIPDYSPPSKVDMYAYPKEFHIFKSQEGEEILVIKLDSPDLANRHKELMKKHNATYDYPEYIPHITLSYDIEGYMSLFEIKEKFTKLLPEKLHIVSEYVEDLDLEWKDKVKSNSNSVNG